VLDLDAVQAPGRPCVSERVSRFSIPVTMLLGYAAVDVLAGLVEACDTTTTPTPTQSPQQAATVGPGPKQTGRQTCRLGTSGDDAQPRTHTPNRQTRGATRTLPRPTVRRSDLSFPASHNFRTFTRKWRAFSQGKFSSLLELAELRLMFPTAVADEYCQHAETCGGKRSSVSADENSN
jgi:hypothetical protein